jgi:co-chaperonin GroES (HSP10)
MERTFHSLLSRVWVARKKVDKVGSIYVPAGSSETKGTIGEVRYAGPEASIVSEGDTVMWGKFAGVVIDAKDAERMGLNVNVSPDEDLLCMNEEDLLCGWWVDEEDLKENVA